jgi:hypothetical protein
MSRESKDICIRQITKRIRSYVWQRYAKRESQIECYTCGLLLDYCRDPWECGHIKSRNNGGLTMIGNLRPVCRKCNDNMGIMDMEEYRKKMLITGIFEENRKHRNNIHKEQEHKFDPNSDTGFLRDMSFEQLKKLCKKYCLRDTGRSTKSKIEKIESSINFKHDIPKFNHLIQKLINCRDSELDDICNKCEIPYYGLDRTTKIYDIVVLDLNINDTEDTNKESKNSDENLNDLKTMISKYYLTICDKNEKIKNLEENNTELRGLCNAILEEDKKHKVTNTNDIELKKINEELRETNGELQMTCDILKKQENVLVAERDKIGLYLNQIIKTQETEIDELKKKNKELKNISQDYNSEIILLKLQNEKLNRGMDHIIKDRITIIGIKDKEINDLKNIINSLANDIKLLYQNSQQVINLEADGF